MPETARLQQKADGLNTYFLYTNTPQTLPLVDDFSIDRTRKRWAQPDDAGVTLTETIYRLEVGGASDTGMRYAIDTTFTYTTDLTDPPTTSRAALPEVQVST